MANEFKIKNGFFSEGNSNITGSLNVSAGITGSLFGTSSWANTATTASYVSSSAISGTVTSASYSQTASYLNTLNQNLTFNGNLTLNGTASITYLNTIYETASVIYSSGSNQFGDATNDTQTLIGTTRISGSLNVTGSATINNLTGSLFGTSSWAQNSVTASYATNAANAFVQGGNSFGTAATIGTNDTQNLNIETSGVTHIFVSSSGRVGIGTTSPQNKLHILSNGDPLALEGTDHVYQEFFPQGFSSGRFGYIGYGSSGSKDFRIYNEAGDGRILLGTSGSSVGADARMSLLGNGNIGVGVSLTSEINAKFHVNNTSNSASFLVEDSTNPDTTPFIIDNAGNVGIGTVTPSSSLHIIEDTGLRVGRTTVGGQYIDINHNIVGAGIPAITSYSSINNAKNLVINATTDASNTPLSAGSIGIVLSTYNTASLWVDSKQFVGVGFTAPTAKLHVTNTSPSASFLVEDSTNPDSTPFVIDAAGLVGIGTTTPATSLHIVSPAVAAAENIQRWQISDSDAYIQLQNGTSTAATFVPTFISGQVTSSNTAAMGFVAGIGADTGTTPAMAFQARSGSAAAILNRPLFRWANYTSDLMWLDATGSLSIGVATAAAKLHINNTSAGNSFLVEDSTNPDSTPFVIDAAGLVGVGTTTPTSLLTVSASGVNGILLGTNTSAGLQEQSGRLMFGSITASNTVTMFANSGSLQIHTGGTPNVSSGTTRMYISSSGNVGIGTSTPTLGTLQVNGNVYATSFTGSLQGTATTASYVLNAVSSSFASTSSFLTSNTNAFIQGGNSFGSNVSLGTNDSFNLALRTAATTRLFISSSGDVGIGTTVPLTKLHVVGNVTATTFVGNLTGTATTASYVLNAVSASFATSASRAVTSSFATTASYAANAANAFIQGGNSFGTAATIGTNDTQNLSIETAGTTRMFISSSGDVGIGITSPTAKLHINNTGAGNSFLVEDSTNPDSTPFVIDANGYVAIGTSSIGATATQLLIDSNIAGDALRVEPLVGAFVVNSSARTGITNGDVNFDPTALLHISSSGPYTSLDQVDFQVGDNNLYVSASGQIGINTSTPNTTLSINGSFSGGYRNVNPVVAVANSGSQLNSTDFIVTFNATTTAIGQKNSIVLPPASTGRMLILNRLGGISNCTISASIGELVNGADAYSFPTTAYSQRTFVSSGTGWYTEP